MAARHLVIHLVGGRPWCGKRDVDRRFRSIDELELLDPVGSPFVDTPIASEPIAGLLKCPQTCVSHLQRPRPLAANPRLQIIMILEACFPRWLSIQNPLLPAKW